MKKFLIFIFVTFSLFGFFNSLFSQQKSASLFLTPSSGNFRVGGTFSVVLALKSEQEPINAVEAILKFDPTILRVRSISKAGSIFTLWPQEPTFSNTQGTIHFVGGVPAPNFYKGSSGKIITIVFEGLKEGQASINFTKGTILSGPGIDVTDKLIGATYTILAGEIPSPPTLTPPAPKISSPTHPDPEKWYSNKNPKLVWEVPENVVAIRILLGKIPTAQPTVVYEPPISSKEFENLEDGIWYFSAQFKNQYGWGEIGRFKIKIDTTPPKDFFVSVDNRGDPKNPRPLFKFETTDEPSGIDYYEVILNNSTFAKVKPEELKDGTWQPPDPLEPKSYTLDVKAFDKAGNSTLGLNFYTKTLASVAFAIEPLPLEISPFPSKIKEGKPLKIEGKTISEANVLLYIQKENEIKVKETRSDGEGRFKFEEFLPLGKYSVWLKVQDQEGRVGFSSKYSVEVTKERIVFYLSVLLIVLIIVGLLIILYLLRKIKIEKEKIKKEKIKKLREEKMKSYKILQEKVREQIKYLESKVDLSRSETKVLEALKKALKEAEQIKSQEESQFKEKS